jgi:hypothetical protein
MSKLGWLAGGLAALMALGWTLSPSAGQEKDLSIKEIMDRAHRGSDSLLQQLGRELSADQPDWPQVQKQTKDLVLLGAALAEDKPRRGSQESWDRLTQQYLAGARQLDKAAQNKQPAEALAAQRQLESSCMACHKAHKGK